MLFFAVLRPSRSIQVLYVVSRSRRQNWIVEVESLGGWDSHVSRVSGLGSRVLGLSIYKRILALRNVVSFRVYNCSSIATA